ncbi:DUF2877 domain-containing protein [Yersinia intermedia]|uniref:DUF2877 domain-containing protein n=1 Tax=Yersinia intermedia TaxID=631 RepID=UPI0030D06082
MDIYALAVSHHASLDYGRLLCVGRFNNAINFLTQNGQLLTLHRAGLGLSPMGWEIASDDFDHIADRLLLIDECQFSPIGIALGDLCIQRHNQFLNLELAIHGEIKLPLLRAVLSPLAAETGLFGQLGDLVSKPAGDEVRELEQFFYRWLRGKVVDWGKVLGKGPGLTPSNDDTLLGMLLVAHLDYRIDIAQLPPFFAHDTEIYALTTRVSASYLQYAERGIFATPLQALAQGLLDPQHLPRAVHGLLQIGHFSGADTLLGVWLGARAITAYHCCSDI